jgi:ABC-type amino acid transport substrate-binding protein
MTRFLRTVVALLLVCSALAHAQSTPKLRAGISERPPFTMKDVDGKWTGLAVDIWESVSSELNLPYEYVEVPLDQSIADAAAGKLDILVGGIGISPDRARQVEFSQPFLAMPAAVAVLRENQVSYWGGFVRDIFSHGVGYMLLVLAGSILIFSIMLWIVERRVDQSHFGGKPWHGFGSALWFSAVTITTVGYGDKTPHSPLGRIVVFFWMFLGVVIISVFTGAIASSITASRMDARITQTRDLAKYRVGALKGSLVQSVLASVGIPMKVYPTLDDAVDALVSGQITALADGEITLRDAVNRKHPGAIVVTPLPNTHVTYALAVRPGFDPVQAKAINVALIEEVTQPGWEQEIERWAGPPAN